MSSEETNEQRENVPQEVTPRLTFPVDPTVISFLPEEMLAEVIQSKLHELIGTRLSSEEPAETTISSQFLDAITEPSVRGFILMKERELVGLQAESLRRIQQQSQSSSQSSPASVYQSFFGSSLQGQSSSSGSNEQQSSSSSRPETTTNSSPPEPREQENVVESGGENQNENQEESQPQVSSSSNPESSSTDTTNVSGSNAPETETSSNNENSGGETQPPREQTQESEDFSFLGLLTPEIRADALRQLISQRPDVISILPPELQREAHELAQEAQERRSYNQYVHSFQQQQQEQGRRELEVERSRAKEEETKLKKWMNVTGQGREDKSKGGEGPTKGFERIIKDEFDLISIFRLFYYPKLLSTDEVRRIFISELNFPSARSEIFKCLFYLLINPFENDQYEICQRSSCDVENEEQITQILKMSEIFKKHLIRLEEQTVEVSKEVYEFENERKGEKEEEKGTEESLEIGQLFKNEEIEGENDSDDDDDEHSEQKYFKKVKIVKEHVREKCVSFLWMLQDNGRFLRLFLDKNEKIGICKNPTEVLLSSIYDHWSSTNFIRRQIVQILENIFDFIKLQRKHIMKITKEQQQQQTKAKENEEKEQKKEEDAEEKTLPKNEKVMIRLKSFIDGVIDSLLHFVKKIWKRERSDEKRYRDLCVSFLQTASNIGGIGIKCRIMKDLAIDLMKTSEHIFKNLERNDSPGWKDICMKYSNKFKKSLDLFIFVFYELKKEHKKPKPKEVEKGKSKIKKPKEEEEDSGRKLDIFELEMIKKSNQLSSFDVSMFLDEDIFNHIWIELDQILSSQKGEFDFKKKDLRSTKVLTPLIISFIKFQSLYHGKVRSRSRSLTPNGSLSYNFGTPMRRNPYSLTPVSSTSNLSDHFSSAPSSPSKDEDKTVVISQVEGLENEHDFNKLQVQQQRKSKKTTLLQQQLLQGGPAASSPITPLLSLVTSEGKVEKFLKDHRTIVNVLISANSHFLKSFSSKSSGSKTTKSEHYDHNIGIFYFLLRSRRLSKYLSFDNKRAWFLKKLWRHKRETYKETLELKIGRNRIFDDAYFQIGNKNSQFLKRDIRVTFKGEKAEDLGGPRREFFLELSRSVINPLYGLFKVMSDKVTYQPNPLSKNILQMDEMKRRFRFVGHFIGMSLFHEQLIDCYFTRSFYKHILGRKLVYSDVESIDQTVYKNLKWFAEESVDGLGFTFTTNEEVFGVSKEIELKKGGKEISVTNENKYEFIRLMTNYQMVSGIEEQLTSFLEGFYNIIPKKLISVFSEHELELLMNGPKEFDVDDLQKNTVYHNGYIDTKECKVIQWFWKWVKDLTRNEKSLFLQFFSGTSKIPVGGFKNLYGRDEICLFNIHRVPMMEEGAPVRLPTSHTCFNQLELPDYKTENQLRKKLFTAIRFGSTGFGFV